MNKAQSLSKDLLANARWAARQEDYAAASMHLKKLLQLEPHHAEASFGLAVMYQKMGRPDEAARWYKRAAELSPRDPTALYNLGLIQQEQGMVNDAIDSYRHAIELQPNLYQALCNLGNIQSALGHHEEALDSYQQALACHPKLLEALLGIGLIYQHQGQQVKAAQMLERILSISPNHSPALFSLGVLFQDQGQFSQAAAYYQRVLLNKPDDVDAHFNLGKAYQDLGQFEKAEYQYRQAIIHSNTPSAPAKHTTDIDTLYYNLGFILKQSGKWMEWRDNFKALEAVSNGSLPLALYGVAVGRLLGDRVFEAKYLSSLIEFDYGLQDIDLLRIALATAHYFDFGQNQLHALYCRFDTLMKERIEACPPFIFPQRDITAAVRIGYLSPDFRHHVMGHMMLEVVKRHDKSKFHIYCYSLNREEDEITQEFKNHSTNFQVIQGVPPRSASELIARDGLDILVDLATHTQGAEPEILAYKPARIQITHIASAGAVGLSAIDFKLTDHFADAEENQRYLIETLLPMEGCVFPYHKSIYNDGHCWSKRDANADDDSTFIGAFVSPMKLSPRCMDVWMKVLEALPRAKLIFSPLKDDEREMYLSIAAAAGITADRMAFIPVGHTEVDKLSRYRLIDFVLDTFPYGGVNGILEPLSMGVPVVTLCGKRHGERTAYSILMNLGVTETIAFSEREYVAIATRLANDSHFSDAVRHAISERMTHSALVDMDLHTRNLEAAYLKALSTL